MISGYARNPNHLNDCVMKAFFADNSRVVFPVGLDDLTVARLMEIADDAKLHPAQLIAAIVRDVLEDDAIAHAADKSDMVIRRDANKDLN